MKKHFFVTALALFFMFQTVDAQLVSNISTRADGEILVAFTSGSGSWTVPGGVKSVEVLVVGGGGAGLGYGGGGGAGGFYFTNSYIVTPGSSLAVTVGSGAAGGSSRAADTGSYPNGSSAANGANSVFDNVIASGGLGGNWTWTSGAGGYGKGGTSGTNNQNSIGGLAADQAANSYGSGSGVGVKGTAAGANNDAGGDGLQSSITGSIIWYGGGGGALVNGPGGQGGGGAGGAPASAGAANTGGGGGAGWAVAGASGGSGIIIITYEKPPPPGTVIYIR